MSGAKAPRGSEKVQELYARYNFLHQTPRGPALARLYQRARSLLSRAARGVGITAPRPPIVQTSLAPILAGLGMRRKIAHVLDAGCGTGGLAADLARQDRGWSVAGVDLTPEHIRICRERYASIPNLRFAVGDLSDPGSLRAGLEIPDGGYDVITSIGVLHHLPEARRGLENLVGVLHREGVLLIYVYDKFARFLAHTLREVVFTLGGDLTPEERVRLTKIVLGYATRTRRYRQLQDEAMTSEHDAVLADTFCHPIEQTYSVHDAGELLGGCGLEIIGFFDLGGFGGDPMMAVDRVLGEFVASAPSADAPWLRGRLERLGGLERAFVVEALTDRHSFQGLLVAAAHVGVYPALN